MDSYGLYEDLSLFNGDLLAGFPLLADEEPPTSLLQAQDGLSSTAKIEAPIAPKPTAKVVLGHPQQGSADLGLADLLASSPTKGRYLKASNMICTTFFNHLNLILIIHFLYSICLVQS